MIFITKDMASNGRDISKNCIKRISDVSLTVQIKLVIFCVLVEVYHETRLPHRLNLFYISFRGSIPSNSDATSRHLQKAFTRAIRAILISKLSSFRTGVVS